MDQISNLLTRIKNASAVRKFKIMVVHSQMTEAILGILKDEGYLDSFELVSIDGHKEFQINISRTKPPVHLRQISKPGQRIYAKKKEIPRPIRGLGLVIISTPKGVISGKQASKQGLGGELICEVW